MLEWFIKRLTTPAPPKRTAVVIPLRVQQPQPWTSDDAKSLRQFLNVGAGSKLRDMLYYELYAQVGSSQKRDDFEQGKHAGACIWMSNLVQLSDVDYYLEVERENREAESDRA